MGRLHGASSRPARRLTAGVVLLVLALVTAACSGGTETGATAERVDGQADETAETTATGPAETTLVVEPEPEAEPRVDPVPGVLASLSTEQKIGQLLMPTLFGQGATVGGDDASQNLAVHGAADPSEIVGLHHLGGIIYLEDNIDSAQQVRAMSRELQVAAEADSGIGLLVAVDQEGGRVSRLSDEMSLFPPAQTMAGDAEQVRVTNYVTGQQVQQQGVNVVLAPVADVIDPATPSFIDDRSFGDDPTVVATMVGAASTGSKRPGSRPRSNTGPATVPPRSTATSCFPRSISTGPCGTSGSASRSRRRSTVRWRSCSSAISPCPSSTRPVTRPRCRRP